MTKGYVSEIFSTLQGEGIYLGERQIFIRLAGCPWRCRYCDTPGSLSVQGHRQMAVEELLDEVHRVQEEKPHRTVSLTGGEPLTQADFLAELLPSLRRLGLRTYLETSGTLPDLLRRVIADCDVVAMDIKLPSSIGREFWKEHQEFLAVAGAKAFVKLVLTEDSTQEEFDRALRVLEGVIPAPPLVLQPATRISELEHRLTKTSLNGQGYVSPPVPHRLVAWWETARGRLPDVRVIPQMHPYWGVP